MVEGWWICVSERREDSKEGESYTRAQQDPTRTTTGTTVSTAANFYSVAWRLIIRPIKRIFFLVGIIYMLVPPLTAVDRFVPFERELRTVNNNVCNEPYIYVRTCTRYYMSSNEQQCLVWGGEINMRCAYFYLVRHNIHASACKYFAPRTNHGGWGTTIIIIDDLDHDLSTVTNYSRSWSVRGVLWFYRLWLLSVDPSILCQGLYT